MGKHLAISAHRTRGTVLIERIQNAGVPASLKLTYKQFETTANNYETAAAKVDKAEEARNDALTDVGSTDATLDALVEALANDLVGAGFGKRKNPFKGYSSYTPADLVGLAYATEVKEVRKLTGKLKKEKLPANIKERIATIEGQCDDVDKALRKLVAPQAAYDKALRKRDGLLLDWTKAEQRLKTIAAAAWIDEPGTFDTVFAPIEDIQMGGSHKRAKSGAKAAKGTDEPVEAPVIQKAAAGGTPVVVAAPVTATAAPAADNDDAEPDEPPPAKKSAAKDSKKAPAAKSGGKKGKK